MKKYLGIDIGGSKVLLGVVSSDGEILSIVRKDYNKAFTRTELQNDLKILKRSINLEGVESGGASIPGLADIKKGVFVAAPFIKERDWYIAKDLSDIFEIPFVIDNDVNCSLLAEKKFGLAKDLSDFVWLTFSNGVGSAIMLNNEIYRGPNGFAGEIGHMNIGSKKRCDCGNIGCLETVSSGRGISSEYFDLTGEQLSAKDIAVLARKGNVNALYVYENSGKAIGTAISYIVNILNINHFIIGGGVSMDFDLFINQIRDSALNHIYRAANNDITVEKTALGYNACLIGAATLPMLYIKDQDYNEK